MTGTQHVNMADVARRAGVSVATVSRALRDQPGVGAATRERVKAVAAELAYVISPEASHLAQGRTGRIAVVVARLDLWFFSAVLSGIESELRGSGFDVLVHQLADAQSRHLFFERLPTRRKADAVIVIALPVPDDDARRLRDLGMQVVLAGGQMLDFPHARIDDVAAARQAVDHLIGLGHRRIAMIRTADPEGAVWATDQERVRGYRDALGTAGLPEDDTYLVTVPFGVEGGAHAMERLLSLPSPPTGVFCHSDEIALGALRTLRRAHVAVPRRISVVGIDDQPTAALSDLTTVHQPVHEQGVLAARMVVDLLQGRTPESTQVVLPTHLVIRGTTGPAPV